MTYIDDRQVVRRTMQGIVGVGVLGVFIAYSLWVRHEQPVLSKPTALAKSASSNSTSSASNTPSTSQSGTNGSSAGANPAKPMPTTTPSGQYKDGTYTGSTADAYYGNVQVAATVSGGKLASVDFIQYPDSHDTSVMINHQAMPYLQQEAIQSQTARVQIISGATFTSEAFIQSLSAALSQAKS